jgi:toxin FitB
VASESRRADRLTLLAAVERTFDALPVDEAVVASYGRLAHLVLASDRNPRARSLDLVIAATAHAHEARLCTRNLADFAGLESVLDVFAP